MPSAAGAGSYRAVLALPSASRLFAPALAGRLAYGLLPLATLFTVHDATGSFTIAGLALACFGLTSLALPFKARLLDRHGPRRTLPALALLCALALAAVTVTGSPPRLIGLTTLAGLAAPPLGPAMRALWSRLTADTNLKERAYALDSVCEETLYLAGPLAVGLLITVRPPADALLLTALLLLTGATAMAAATPPAVRPPPFPAAVPSTPGVIPPAPVAAASAPVAVPLAPVAVPSAHVAVPSAHVAVPLAPAAVLPIPGGAAPPVPAAVPAAAPVSVGASSPSVPIGGRSIRERLRDAGPPRSAALLGVLMTVLSAATAASWIYPALAASALAQGHPAAAGWLEAAVAAGSVTGGLLWARRRHTRPRHSHLAGLLALQATGLAVAAVVAHRPHDLGSPTLGLSALGVASALAGLGVAPLFVVAYLAADDLAPPERRIEAGTWVNVVANVGSAAGSAAGGFLTQTLGPSAALIGAALLATAAAITATRRRRSARFSHAN